MDPLLRLLEENALATHETLAAQLDTTPADIKKRIKQLEHDRVILAYKALVDDERANRTHVKAVGIEVRITPGARGRLRPRRQISIAQYREVQSCFLMSGGFDLSSSSSRARTSPGSGRLRLGKAFDPHRRAFDGDPFQSQDLQDPGRPPRSRDHRRAPQGFQPLSGCP